MFISSMLPTLTSCASDLPPADRCFSGTSGTCQGGLSGPPGGTHPPATASGRRASTASIMDSVTSALF